ncbi:2Fe-2S iron-sulfur cluster binding domain-containing protein [Paramagnetospirillum caucaseum]|uniref:2Fe-2S iron-sulfur cluster binding domain-containing protein n=1 Tax=Paramagnetospirillum caucaseum TaxID=1244869 RepID=M2Y8A0_9PROT|nr:(2Fe-2S)-binding protein [Paramagnetospirillum caucaseum]EME69281.1 2Fe-2S iron-sulfur cluster binding domain-containing protein [Paramagnetospirillum caucaseum]
MMSVETEINFKLNGREVSLRVPATMKALAMLRDRLGLTGTKYACGEGECGACTINVDGKTVNSCLMYAVDCDGREVVTVEGLRTPEGLHPVQQAFVDHGAIQCGFCTPGMIMQAQHLLENNPTLTREEAKRGLEGNICRCTGYTKVLDAVEAVADKNGRCSHG